MNSETQDVSLLDPVCSYNVTNEDGYPFPEKECSEDDDSDEEYASIQRPAFLVEGEPNFDSGSPEDGFEYLRRVRYDFLSCLSHPLPFSMSSIMHFLQFLGYMTWS